MAPEPTERLRYSLVIPVFNEEAVLPVLLRRIDALLGSLDAPAEAIFVDDGSSDTGAVVYGRRRRTIRAIVSSPSAGSSDTRLRSAPAWMRRTATP